MPFEMDEILNIKIDFIRVFANALMDNRIMGDDFSTLSTVSIPDSPYHR